MRGTNPAGYARYARWLAMVGLMAVVLLCSLFLAADESSANGIAPQFSTLVMKPGESRKLVISLVQYQGKDAEIAVSPAHCYIDKEGRLIFADAFSDLGLKVDERTYSAVPFLKTEKTGMKQNEWKEVEVTVSVPKGTSPGEYYAALVARPTNLVSALSVVVEPLSPKPECRVASVETPFVNNQLMVRGVLENTGTRTVLPSAAALIKRDGKVVDALALEVSGKPYEFVMHGNVRRFSGVVQSVLPVSDNYSVEVIVTYGPNQKATAEKSFSIDRNMYLKQKGAMTVQANPTSTKIAVPPGGFYALPLSVKNIDGEQLSVKIFASDRWAVPAMPELTLEPEEGRVVSLALYAPKTFEKLETTVYIVPNRGRPYQIAVTVYPKRDFREVY